MKHWVSHLHFLKQTSGLAAIEIKFKVKKLQMLHLAITII